MTQTDKEKAAKYET